jgi:hypothetical protein
MALVVLTFAACTTTPPPSTVTTSLIVTTTTPVTTTAEVVELERSSEPLSPGPYTNSEFTPAITFDVSGEWYAVQMFNGFFDIQRDVGSPDVIAVQFANVDRVFGADPGSVPVTSAAEAAALVESNQDLTILASDQSRIGGLDGRVVEVENTGQTHASVLHVPPGDLGIDSGRNLWIAFFDTEDGVLAIMVGGSTAKWDQTLAAAEPVLETVTISD